MAFNVTSTAAGGLVVLMPKKAAPAKAKGKGNPEGTDASADWVGFFLCVWRFLERVGQIVWITLFDVVGFTLMFRVRCCVPSDAAAVESCAKLKGAFVTNMSSMKVAEEDFASVNEAFRYAFFLLLLLSSRSTFVTFDIRFQAYFIATASSDYPQLKHNR